MLSLDNDLPTGETRSSGRNTLEAAQLPLFPVVNLFEDVLVQLSTEKSMHLDYDGLLVKAADEDGRTLIANQAASLASIVGADVRFASYLRAQLAGAECGDKLHTMLESAAGATGVTGSNVWAHPDSDVTLARAIRGVCLTAQDSLPSGVECDAIRRDGFIQAIGGLEFRVRLPLYTLWILTPARVRRRPVYQALFNMGKDVNGQLAWQAWEVIWMNLEVLLPKAQSLVSGRSTVILPEQYPSTTHFGADLRTLSVVTDFLPTYVSQRELPALLLRYLA